MSVSSLKIDFSPHAIKRGCPSTHVIRWCGSPGMANRGNGQKRAALASTFVGQVKPTTAIKTRK